MNFFSNSGTAEESEKVPEAGPADRLRPLAGRAIVVT